MVSDSVKYIYEYSCKVNYLLKMLTFFSVQTDKKVIYKARKIKSLVLYLLNVCHVERHALLV